MEKKRQEAKLNPDLFFWKSINMIKASDQQLRFNMFLWTLNKNKGPEIYSILIFWRVWDYLLQHILCMVFHFSNTFCIRFFKKNIYHAIFYKRTTFHHLIDFTSWDIRQYVYCNYLLYNLWHHKFWK